MLSKLLGYSVKISINSVVLHRNFNSILEKCRQNIFRSISTSASKNALPRNVKEMKFKRSDKVGDEFSMIYRAPMQYYLVACNYITSLTCLGVCVFTIARMFNKDEYQYDKTIYYGDTLTADESEYIYFLIGFIVMCLSIRVMIHRYPLRIYKNNDKYLAIFESQFPLKKSKVEFSKGEVISLPESGVLPWRDSRYKINNRKVLLLADYFKSPSELFQMMKQQ